MVLTYKKTGVDLDAADLFEEMIKDWIRNVWPGDEEKIGKFAGTGRIPHGSHQFAAGTDGTGTKIILAAMMGELDGIGQEAVAMSATDVYGAGSTPRYLLDTLKVARLHPQLHIRVIESVIRGCVLAGCRLIGGETAELPGMFRHAWMIDLDTTVIGFPDPGRTYDAIEEGQKIYGWPSFGVASNGFSLIRRVFGLQQPKTARPKLMTYYPSLGQKLWQALLIPTPIWIREIEAQCMRGVRFAGHAHITGVGMPGNIPRILPPQYTAVIDRSAWKRPPIFPLIQKKGLIASEEMDRVFNNGIMLVSVISNSGKEIDDDNATLIGEVRERKDDEPQVELVGEYRDA